MANILPKPQISPKHLCHIAQTYIKLQAQAGPDLRQPFLQNNNFNIKLTLDHSKYLDWNLTKLEVLAAIKHLRNNKAPGCNSLPIVFYKKFYHLLVEHTVNTCNHVMQSSLIPKSWLEASIIVLLKKVRTL